MLGNPIDRRYVTIPQVKIVVPSNGTPLGIQDYLNAANIKIKKHVDNLNQKLSMAVEVVEDHTGRALLTRTVDQLIDYDVTAHMDILTLREAPVRKVVEIAVRDPFGNETIVAPTAYFTSDTRDPYTTVGLFPGQIWGSFLTDFEAFRVRTISGYSTLVSAIDTATNTLTAVGHPYQDGDIVRFQQAYQDETAPIMPTGLSVFTNYYAINVATDTLQISATSGGSAIDLTDSGAGKLFIGEIPEKIRRAIMIAAVSDYLEDEFDSTGKPGSSMPVEVKDLLRRYKRVWL